MFQKDEDGSAQDRAIDYRSSRKRYFVMMILTKLYTVGYYIRNSLHQEPGNSKGSLYLIVDKLHKYLKISIFNIKSILMLPVRRRYPFLLQVSILQLTTVPALLRPAPSQWSGLGAPSEVPIVKLRPGIVKIELSKLLH